MMRRYSQWFMLLFALLLLLVVFAYNKIQMQAPDQPPGQSRNQTSNEGASPTSADISSTGKSTKSRPKQAPDVTVLTVQPASYQAQITVYGAAEAQYKQTLKAQVTGQVTAISRKFDSGLRLALNDELLQVNDSAYRAAMANAKAEVAEARLSLLEAEREAIQARTEWQAVGLEGNPDSELVLHEPQLTAAKATLAKAEASLASARRDLNNTRIVAPFDALVVERLVAPGSYLQTGSDVATLYSSGRVEIALALPARDWQNLPDADTLTQGNWPVQLFSVEEGKSWQGRVTRLEQHLDETTRQRTLIVAVDHPLDHSPALFPGTFLRAQIKGRKVEGLWQLPNSALSQRSEIWYLQQDNTLASFVTQPLFSDADSIYVSVPIALTSSSQQVLVSPLNSYLQGMGVNPAELAGKTGNDHE